MRQMGGMVEEMFKDPAYTTFMDCCEVEEVKELGGAEF